MMVVQITQAHHHVVSDRIRHRYRHAEAQDAMDKAKRVKIAIAKEESTRDDSPGQSCHREHKAREVCGRKQQCCGNNGRGSVG